MNLRRTISGLKEIVPLVVPAFGLTSALIGVILLISTINFGCGEENGAQTTGVTQPPAATTTTTTPGAQQFTFGTPKKAAHYESNTPAHEMILPAPPINVVIDFNFDLAPPSTISIMSNGQEYGIGETQIDDSKLALRRDMDPQAPDGLYEVSYRACWPDQSCHDGNFQFAIDRSLAGTFTDLRNMTEVAVVMNGIAFQPQNILISKGTKVTWTNSDPVEHFVNTDTHPAHTYYPEQNSRGLAQGASFSVSFTKPGAYPYHCSAHAAQMMGMVLVQ